MLFTILQKYLNFLTKYFLKITLGPICELLLLPSFRYSGYLPLIQNYLTYSPREEMLRTAMAFVAVSKLEGDYLEFGVYQGRIFVPAFYFAKMNKLQSMKLYAFDSFQGLPEIRGVDADGVQQFNKGDYLCDPDLFRKIISQKGVDLNKVSIISGWYNEVLNNETKKKLSIKKASIIWVDCDLYESTVPVLNFVTDYIQDGTILIFDDWFCFKGNPDRGEQKAFSEWLKKNPSIKATSFHKFGWNGNSFIIHIS